jgi:hypothetical protein
VIQFPIIIQSRDAAVEVLPESSGAVLLQGNIKQHFSHATASGRCGEVHFSFITRYGFALRWAAEWMSRLLAGGSLPQSLRSSSGAPAGGVLNELSMQGMALKYS